MAEGFAAEIEHTSIDYNEFTHNLAVQLVNKSLPFVQAEVQNVLKAHRITGETEASIQVRPVSQTEQTTFGVRGEVYTDVIWGPVLEYTAVPFMRLGARKARKRIRPLVKQIFGDNIKGVIRMRRRRK